MKSIKLIKQMIFFLTIFCIPILIVGCSDDEQPESLQFSINIQDGKLVSGSETFKAKQGDTVSFNIESDKTDPHDIHGSLFESELLEIGDKFSFSFGEDLTGKMIKFHNHMNHEKEGSIMVNNDSENSDSFQIEVNESGFIPVKISVKPGTNVTWSNSGTKRAKIVSGPPPKMPGDHAHEEDDEIILGSLEIYPR